MHAPATTTTLPDDASAAYLGALRSFIAESSVVEQPQQQLSATRRQRSALAPCIEYGDESRESSDDTDSSLRACRLLSVRSLLLSFCWWLTDPTYGRFGFHVDMMRSQARRRRSYFSLLHSQPDSRPDFCPPLEMVRHYLVPPRVRPWSVIRQTLRHRHMNSIRLARSANDFAVDADDNFIVACNGARWPDSSPNHDHLVDILDRDGKYIRSIGTFGTDRGQLHSPCAVVVDNDGNIVVSDWKTERIQVYRPDGTHVRQSASGLFPCPVESVAVDSENNLVVLDNAVCVLRPDLSILQRFNPWRKGDTGEPYDLAVDGSDTIVVSNRFHVDAFRMVDASRRFVRSFPSIAVKSDGLDEYGVFVGDAPTFWHTAIAADAEGNIIVSVDNSFYGIDDLAIFDCDGNAVQQFHFGSNASAIALDSVGNMLLLTRDHLQVWS